MPRTKAAGRSRSSAVQNEIKQARPFRSTAQEATIALLRTASIVSRALARVVNERLAESVAEGRYGEVALELFRACVPAIPYVPPAAIAARPYMPLTNYWSRPSPARRR